MGKFENSTIDMIEEILGVSSIRQFSFDWLLNTHLKVDKIQCKELLDKVFIELSGDKDKLIEKRVCKLKVDAFFPSLNLCVEIDELQHFSKYRLMTLEILNSMEDIKLGYNIVEYKEYCKDYAEAAIRKGPSGYRETKAEFPFIYGRAYQRAYFDTMRDVLIPAYLSKPVLRISELDLLHITNEEDMVNYLRKRLQV